MNNVDVLLIPEVLNSNQVNGRLVIVIDVLRASSTIVTAMHRGCKCFVPIFSVEEARNKSARLNDADAEVLLCGERKGKKIKGFDLGNSPTEYTQETVKGKKIVFTTTNGVKTLEMVKAANQVIICSFLNLKAIQNYCLSFNGDVLIVCSGKEGRFSLEDAVCAGMLIESFNENKSVKFRQTDANLTVRLLYKNFTGNILGMLKK